MRNQKKALQKPDPLDQATEEMVASINAFIDFYRPKDFVPNPSQSTINQVVEKVQAKTEDLINTLSDKNLSKVEKREYVANFQKEMEPLVKKNKNSNKYHELIAAITASANKCLQNLNQTRKIEKRQSATTPERMLFNAAMGKAQGAYNTARKRAQTMRGKVAKMSANKSLNKNANQARKPKRP